MDNTDTKDENLKILLQVSSCLDTEKYNELKLLIENGKINSEGKIDWNDFFEIMGCMNWETGMLWEENKRLEKEKEKEEKLKNYYKDEASYQRSRKIKSRHRHKVMDYEHKKTMLTNLKLEDELNATKQKIQDMSLSKYFEKEFPSLKTVNCQICYCDVEEKDIISKDTCSNKCNIDICNGCLKNIDKCPNCRNSYEYELYYNNEDYESDGEVGFDYLDSNSNVVRNSEVNEENSITSNEENPITSNEENRNIIINLPRVYSNLHTRDYSNFHTRDYSNLHRVVAEDMIRKSNMKYIFVDLIWESIVNKIKKEEELKNLINKENYKIQKISEILKNEIKSKFKNYPVYDSETRCSALLQQPSKDF